MAMLRALAILFTLIGATTPAQALESALQLSLTLEGEVQRTLIDYRCGEDDALRTVEYINAAPTFLALVPIAGETRLFVNVVSGSGARYVAGRYVWSNDGNQSRLIDETAPEDAEPLICTEFNEIP